MTNRLNSRILILAAACAVAGLAFAHTPARAEQPASNLGPVGPYEPILAAVGDKRLVAYYVPENGKCTVTAVFFDAASSGGGETSTRLRMALHPGEIFNLDAVSDQRVVLACGLNAGMLTVLNRGEVLRSASNA
ncbi:MAG: hypothetical protein ACREDO_07390, partial [Methyloceanibacter sp.]